MNGSQRSVLVTGGTRGIGQALVRRLLADGARVMATGRTAASVAMAASLHPQVQWVVCDLGVAADRAALALQATAFEVNWVIHNAGVQQLRDFTQAGDDEAIDLQAECDVNLLAPVDLSRRLAPGLRHRPGPVMVFVSSGLALAPKRSSPLYCATKAGLRSFAKSLRAQMQAAQWPVQIVEALLPLVDTDMTAGRGRSKISADEAARQILEGTVQGKREVYVGAAALLKWIMRVSPALGERIMIAR
jgi:uncharacterized oxidoreductase